MAIMTETPERRVRRTMLATAAAVKQARDIAEAVLFLWGQVEQAENARLVVSELVTNAANAKPYGRIVLDVALLPIGICIEVTDEAHEEPHLRTPAPEDESGRGLLIVQALAEACGTRHTPDGKVVWAILKRLTGA